VEAEEEGMTDERRQGKPLVFKPTEGLMVVGDRVAVLEARPSADQVVGTYVDLVVAQRAVTPASHHDLRDRELVQLADLLELPAAEFDAMIDRELERLLGAGSAHVIAGRLRLGPRPVALAAALAVVAAVAVGWASTSGGDPSPSGATSAPTVTVADLTTVEVVELPDGSTATRTEWAPIPPSDGVNIAGAVEYQRNP
jgi:hypothetical protein